MKAWVMKSTAWSSRTLCSPTALLRCVRQHLYSHPETPLIPNSVELSHSETMLSSNLFFFFEMWQTLLPCSWPLPLDNSSVITWGISDQHTKIISHSPGPWLKERTGSLPSQPQGSFLEGRDVFLMTQRLIFERVLSSAKACCSFSCVQLISSVNNPPTTTHLQIVGVAHEQFIL